MKNILFVTGTRADFGKLEPLAKAAQKEGFDVGFFVTGMHMMKKYGETRIEVKRFEGVEIFEYVNQKEGDSLDSILSKTIVGFSDFVYEHKPDLVVIHGDRIEALAVSLVCATNYIYSSHVEGGEVSGTIDESIRHCNSKLCSTHFVSGKEAAERVRSLGEPSERIYIIGSPELDSHLKPSGVDIAEVKKRYDIPFDDYGIVIFHSITSEIDTILSQSENLYDCLKKTGRNFVVIAPNNDPGSDGIFEMLSSLPLENFRIIPSMRFNYFSELMKNASIMVGNSSAGVREAPFVGIASIDIGTRQSNRSIAESLSHCSPIESEGILRALRLNWGRKFTPSTEFGDGNSSSKFVEAIASRKFWSYSDQKLFADR